MTSFPLRSGSAALVAMVVLTGCSSAGEGGSVETLDHTTPGPPIAPGAAPADTAGSLESVATEFVASSPGGAEVLVQRDGVLHRTAVGTGSNAGDPLVEGRPFRVGSVAKPLVAVMVLQLVDEGVVDLDTALEEYLPRTVVGGEATIRQLLSHEGGVPNYTDQPEFFTDVLADPSRIMTQTEVLSYVADVSPGPVGQFAYSNTNYILLGQVIETLDGTDLNTSLSMRVTGPLELDHTFFDTGTQPLTEDLASGWSPVVSDGTPDAHYSAIASSAWAAGALVSTTQDLAGFLAALGTGHLISADSFAAMTDFGPAGYGLGLRRVNFSATQSGIGHSGSIPGYTSTMAIDPTTGDTLVIVTNNDVLVADQLAERILASQPTPTT